MNKKTLFESSVEMRQMVMPNDSNPHNTVFGGVVMSWMDLAASMVASRHAGTPVVTVHIENISFMAPIQVGEHALIKAALQYVGKSSMEIKVDVYSENPYTKVVRHTTTAFLTFVALAKSGKPTKVLKPLLNSIEEKEAWKKAEKRIAERFRTSKL